MYQTLPAATEQHVHEYIPEHEFRYMASNWPPSWLNDQPRDPEPDAAGNGAPARAPSPPLALPMPPPGVHPEIGLSQLPSGRKTSHRERTSNGYMPDAQQSAAGWPSDTPQHHPDLYDDVLTPVAGGQNPWPPPEAPGSYPTGDHKHGAAHPEPAKQEDIALLLELQCACPHFSDRPDFLKVHCFIYHTTSPLFCHTDSRWQHLLASRYTSCLVQGAFHGAEQVFSFGDVIYNV